VLHAYPSDNGRIIQREFTAIMWPLPFFPILFCDTKRISTVYGDNNACMAIGIEMKNNNVIDAGGRGARWEKRTRNRLLGVHIGHMGKATHFVGILHGGKGKSVSLKIISPNKFDTLPFFPRVNSIHIVILQVILIDFTVGYDDIFGCSTYSIRANIIDIKIDTKNDS
jgi:hypothetical protein